MPFAGGIAGYRYSVYRLIYAAPPQRALHGSAHEMLFAALILIACDLTVSAVYLHAGSRKSKSFP